MRTPTVRRRILAALLAIGALGFPAVASAHPLGNFTINHYAVLRVGPSEIRLDVVVDLAEIPAFQERIRIDANGDGDVSEAEAAAARESECTTLAPSLDLQVDGTRTDLSLVAAGLTFPAGAGGVPTMRTVCEFVAARTLDAAAGALVTFADTSSIERIGWREIVVLGDEVAIGAVPNSPLPASSDRSARLTAYPKDLLTQPLNEHAVAFTVTSGGAALPAFNAPDAQPVGNLTPSTSPDASGNVPTSAPTATPGPAVVPGGVSGEIPDLFRADLTPFVALASILLAVALGAGHALTPGHGKTLMAAYLVGTRGTVRHAAGLGLAVTVSHTLGILFLALLVTGAESLLPADVVVRTIPIVAALAFVAIGGAMLFTELRRRVRARALTAAAHGSAHDHGHGHGEAHDHDSGHDRAHAHADAGAGVGAAASAASAEHSHGGIRHSHLPADDRTLSWKNLFALGLAGGIIPSTNALIILLGTIVAGRAAFGIVLVVAFGLGMALVLGGVGALMVLARERMERLPLTSSLGRAARHAPLAAAVVVLGVGLWLTVQAIGGGPTL
ncbi:MAG: hypothetical protein ABI573_08900 [Chloroflexota bacterium]